MSTFREKVTGIIGRIKQRKMLSLLAIVILVAAIPATILLEQSNTDNRQHAAETVQINTSSVGQVGGQITVGWANVNYPNNISPTSAPVGPLQFRADPRFCVLKADGKCKTTLKWDAPSSDGLPSSVSIKVRQSGNVSASDPLVTTQGPTGSVEIPWITDAGASFDLYYNSETQPRSTIVVVKGYYPYTLQLTNSAGQGVGQKTYIDCTPVGSQDPPTGSYPLGAGRTCAFPIATGISNGQYKITMYGADGVSVVATSVPISISGGSDNGGSGGNVVTPPAATTAPASNITMSATPNPCVVDTEGRCATTLSWNAPGVTNVRVTIKENPEVTLGTTASGNAGPLNYMTEFGSHFELYGNGSSTPLATLFVKGVKQNTLTATENPCLVDAEGRCHVQVFWSSDQPNLRVTVKESPTVNLGSTATGTTGVINWVTEQGVTFQIFSGSNTTPIQSLYVQGLKQNKIRTNTGFCVMSSASQPCTVTAYWSSDQPNIHVKVKVPNDPTETEVASSSKGQVDIPWVTQAGDIIELYSGDILLDSVMVGGVSQNTINAVPNPCLTGPNERCTTSLVWSTVNKSNLVIKVRAHTYDPAKFDTDTAVTGTGLAPSGKVDVDWITAANPTFDLYADNVKTPLASVTVQGLAPNRITAPATSCFINGQGVCTIPISWSTKDSQNVSLQVRQTDDPSNTWVVVAPAHTPSGNNVAIPWITKYGDTFQLFSGTTPIGEPLTLRGKEAVLTASTNPCVTGSNGRCSTTISYDATGLPNVKLTVKQSQDPNLDPVLRNGPVKDSFSVDWITQAGDVFQLYSGNDLIKTLVVGGVAQNSLSAAPNPCTIGSDSKCTSTLFWSTTNKTGLVIKVRASTDAPAKFDTDTPVTGVGLPATGLLAIDWISSNDPTFDLYADGSTAPLATITVKTTIGTNTTGVKFATTAVLPGVGNAGNKTPKHTSRNAWVTLFDTNNVLVATKEGKITFDATTGKFAGTLDRDSATNPLSIPAGNYTAKLQTPQFLRKNIPGIFAVHSDQSTTLPEVQLIVGDTNMDNKLDILDYNNIRSCFGGKISSAECLATPQFTLDGAPAAPIAPLADLNDDGVVDLTDYNLFIISLATQRGD